MALPRATRPGSYGTGDQTQGFLHAVSALPHELSPQLLVTFQLFSEAHRPPSGSLCLSLWQFASLFPGACLFPANNSSPGSENFLPLFCNEGGGAARAVLFLSLESLFECQGQAGSGYLGFDSPGWESQRQVAIQSSMSPSCESA